MKRIIFFITIILLHINCWAQSNKNIIQLDIYAVNFTGSYYIPPTVDELRVEGVHLTVPYRSVKKSGIHKHLTKLKLDTKRKGHEVGDYRAIMTVMYEDMTKNTYYITLRNITNGDKAYRSNGKLIKAIYSLLPKYFELEDDDILYEDNDKRYDEDE